MRTTTIHPVSVADIGAGDVIQVSTGDSWTTVRTVVETRHMDGACYKLTCVAQGSCGYEERHEHWLRPDHTVWRQDDEPGGSAA